MLRRVLAAVVATAACLVTSVGPSGAQTSPTGSALVTAQFSLSAPGSSPALALTGGQSNCAVTVSSSTSFTGLSLIPQAASDGPNQPATWLTVSSIGSGSITAVGTFLGSVTSAGLTNFRVTVGALTGGTVTGTIACSSAGGGGSHVVIDNPAIQVYTPQSTGNGAQPAQAVLSYGQAWNAATSNFDNIWMDPSHSLYTTTAAGHRFDLTSSSTSGSCVSLGTSAGRLSKLWNSGPATTVYLTLYDEGASPTCANADRLFGDGATIVVPSGGTAPLTFDTVLYSGLAYKLSAALSSTQSLHITTSGLGF